jgi:hypothetical protein
MLATVYRTRDRGIRLPRPHSPVTGDLLLEVQTRGGESMQVASLMGDSGKVQMLPTLFKARVLRVTANGLVIAGKEPLTRGQQKSKVEFKPQTWWAFIHTDRGIYRYDGNDPLDFMADEAVLARGGRSTGP